MARLWLDEEFTTHPKLLQLGSRDNRWTWLEVLVYTCKYGDPRVPAAIRDVIPKATKAFLEKCVTAGLLDRDSVGGLVVHDWRHYQGTVEDRVAAFLDRNPYASANEVQQAVAGRRQEVLAAVKRFHKTTESGSREPGDGGSTEPEMVVPKVVPSVPIRKDLSKGFTEPSFEQPSDLNLREIA